MRKISRIRLATPALSADRPGRAERSHQNVRIVLLLTGLFAVLVSASCDKAGAVSEKPPVPVSVQPVELHTPSHGVRYTASIVPAAQVETSFRVAGYVTRLHTIMGADGRPRSLQAGDYVAKGTVLGQLRSDEYAVKVAQTEAQMSEAKSALATAEAQLREAQAALARAAEELTRSKNLFETESITKRDFEAAQTQNEVSEARVQVVESQINAIKAKLSGAGALVEEASLARNDTVLVAPISGTVVKRLAEVGTFVGPGRPVFILADTGSLRAVFGVPDVDLSQLRGGTEVTLTTDAIPGQRIKGQVISIAPSADPRTRVFDVEVAVPKSAKSLRMGMICSLELAGRETPANFPVIPISSIVRPKRGSDLYAVYVVDEGSGRKVCRLREVSLGETFGNRVAVTKGLNAGEKVVTVGSTIVQDGDRVQVVAW